MKFMYKTQLNAKRVTLGLLWCLICALASPNIQALQVHSLKSKLALGEVPDSTPYTVQRTQGNWQIVKFTLPIVAVWVSSDYVRLEADEAVVIANRLNMRMGPSLDARVLTAVTKDYRSKVLGQSDGFTQVYAPAWALFAVPTASSPISSEGVSGNTSSDASVAAKWQTSKEPEAVDKSVKAQSSQRNYRANRNTQRSGNISGYTQQQADDFLAELLAENQQLSPSSTPAEPQINEDASAATIATGKPVKKESIGKQAAAKQTETQTNTRFANVPEVVNQAEVIARQHRLSPGDSISLQVFGEPDLSLSTVRIPQSGLVSFPLIGSIDVANKTTEEVEGIVRSALTEGYIKNPRLSVTIESYRPVFVRGGVGTTGAFPYTEGLTVAKAIALAGGTKNSAKQNGVSISRNGALVQNNLSLDSEYQIYSGDILTVDEEVGVTEEAGFYVYLHGEVKSPGEYAFRRGLTVEKAIVLAGGFTLRASRKRVSISRIIEGNEAPERIKKVNLYMPVQPGDIIDVGASWF